MNSKSAIKSAALCLRGFELHPEQVALLIGVAASETGASGEPARLGSNTLLKRSFVRYSVEFPDGCRMDEMIPKILNHVGGVKRILEFRDQIKPEFFEIDLVLPVKSSDEQEGGFLPPSTLAELSLLGASLSFQFL